MLLQELYESRGQLRPMCLRIEVVQDVVAIVEGHTVVAGGQAVVRHPKRAPRALWVDEHVLAPADNTCAVLHAGRDSIVNVPPLKPEDSAWQYSKPCNREEMQDVKCQCSPGLVWMCPKETLA